MQKLNRWIKICNVVIITWYCFVVLFLCLRMLMSKSLREFILVFIGAVLSFLIGILAIRYEIWLNEVKSGVLNVKPFYWGSSYKEYRYHYAIYMSFERFKALYAIDQKESWSIGECCTYTTKKNHQEPGLIGEITIVKYTKMFVYFSPLGYMQFKDFKKQLKKAETKKKNRAESEEELEAQAEFIKQLQKDVTAFLGSNPAINKEEQSCESSNQV